ncbi:MAG: LD-carboxypeptidase [Lachnospira sp.]|nr:LD-carboxypeptidase [Lachnospira sp.]MDD5828798.1 LD-carboxypeptidase [Lachnospira sp.]
MRYPKYLHDGGKIGFVAPSFGCAIEPYKTGFLKAQNNFKEMGYGIELGPNCYEQSGIGISNTPAKCGQELMDMYESSDNDILISCGGGELMCEILEFVDFNKLSVLPAKWYLGYSDNTNFTFLQNILCDTAAIYGPCAATFGMSKYHQSLKDTLDILTGKSHVVKGYEKWEAESLKTAENPVPEYNLTEIKKLVKYVEGKKVTDNEENIEFSGRLIGGCLDCLVNMTGTKYDKVKEFNEKYKKDGIIWFLESCDLNVMSIRRAMWNLDNAGWFENLKGFIIGRPLVFGQELMGLDQYDAVMGVIGKYNVPVIMDADIGHLPPSMPVVSGSYAKVNVKADDITIEYQFK